MTKAILVTGGAGYIGSYTLQASSGFCPVTLDNLSTGNRTAVKWGGFVNGESSNDVLICSVIRRHDNWHSRQEAKVNVPAGSPC